MMSYIVGLCYSIFWGVFGEGTDQSGINFFGDASHPAAQFSMEAAMAEVPEQAGLSDHKKVSFWFRFATIRSYGQVLDLFERVVERLTAMGWSVAPAIEGTLDTGSSVDNLADTDDPKFWSQERDTWLREPNAGGYNAAGGFTVVVEKVGEKPEFSLEEIETLKKLMAEFNTFVYDRPLPASEVVAG